jgi:hypothetical protein
MDTERSLLKEFLDGGWMIPMIGAGAMIARLLSTDSKLSLIDQFKKILTAAIAAGISWFVLEQTDISSLYKAITYGIIGVISPEVIDGIIKLAKKFSEKPEKFFKK